MRVRSLRDVRRRGEPASRSRGNMVVRPVLACARRERRRTLTPAGGTWRGEISEGRPGRFSLAPLSGTSPHNDSLVAAEVLRIFELRNKTKHVSLGKLVWDGFGLGRCVLCLGTSFELQPHNSHPVLHPNPRGWDHDIGFFHTAT